MSGFEPNCNGPFTGPAEPERVALVSIAISLKRIADEIAGNPPNKRKFLDILDAKMDRWFATLRSIR